MKITIGFIAVLVVAYLVGAKFPQIANKIGIAA